jgi:hypothetical protein
MIADDTALLPQIVARCVREEAGRFLGEELPESIEKELAALAETIYAHNERWARSIRRGTAGRDMLYAFMRHWLAGWLKDNRPILYARMPPRYYVGGRL